MLVLLDLDGTLVDRDLAFRRWIVDLAHRHNADNAFVEWVLSEDRGGAWDRRELFASIRDRLGLEGPLDDLAAAFMSEFTSLFACDPETVSALERAHVAGHKLAIVTNGGPTQLDKIKASGLDELVDAVCVSSIEGVAKPDPRLLEIAASRADATLNDAWLIGDTPASDIACAHTAGIGSVWIRNGQAWPLEEFTPTLSADTVSEALDLVLRSATDESSR